MVRILIDAMVIDAVRQAPWRTDTFLDRTRHRGMSPEGLYGPKKMTALIRRTAISDASCSAVDRAMPALGLSGVRGANPIRTTIPSKDRARVGDLLNRDFTAPGTDHTSVMDFMYVRSWAGGVYVGFILDLYWQRIIA